VLWPTKIGVLSLVQREQKIEISWCWHSVRVCYRDLILNNLVELWYVHEFDLVYFLIFTKLLLVMNEACTHMQIGGTFLSRSGLTSGCSCAAPELASVAATVMSRKRSNPGKGRSQGVYCAARASHWADRTYVQRVVDSLWWWTFSSNCSMLFI
jgi:hypothetical protein